MTYIDGFWNVNENIDYGEIECFNGLGGAPVIGCDKQAVQVAPVIPVLRSCAQNQQPE